MSKYIEKTKISTYYFQKSLLRLPIPKLEDTLSRYLNAVQPVVSKEAFEKTQLHVKEFDHNLHAQLLKFDNDNKHTSYINQYWLDMYLSDRRPLVINVNPQVRLRDDPNSMKNNLLQRSCSLISSSVRFYKTLKDGQLSPDIFHTKPEYSKSKWFPTLMNLMPTSYAFYGAAALGAYPLDMSQYKNLFQSTRIPIANDKDILQVFPDSKHIIVQLGTQFYTMNVLDESGNQIPDHKIYAGLRSIVNTGNSSEKDDLGIGLLTTLPRDEWGKHRKLLIDNGNQEALSMIDSALFAVSLENQDVVTNDDLSECFLYGNGSNRWFDKSFQLIITKNGKASVNFEHAWGDGVAVLRYLNETFQDSVKQGPIDETQCVDAKNVQTLNFQINDAMKDVLIDAKKKFLKWTNDLVVTSGESSISKDEVQKFKIGIDGLLQMTIQLAHYKLHNKFVATYESASTSAFKHGRTETIRSCTNESVQFCKTMCDSNATSQDKHIALRNAVKKHGVLTKAGVMGQGFDRHLFGMKQMALAHNSKMPALFTDESSDIMNKIILSTSTLSSPHLEGGSFGPVNEDCYGVGYGMEESSLFQLSAYRKDASQLSELLVSSLQEIHDVLASNSI